MNKAMKCLLLLLPALAGCDVLFPAAVDPCPLPASQHPEAWIETPITTAAGDVVGWTYICTGPGIIVR